MAIDTPHRVRGGEGRPAPASEETQAGERQGTTRRIVLGGVAGATALGLTGGAWALLRGWGSGSGGTTPGEGTQTLTGPNRVQDAIERNPRVQEALAKFFGSDTIVVTPPTPAQIKRMPAGSAFANINASNSGGMGVNVTLDHPNEGVDPRTMHNYLHPEDIAEEFRDDWPVDPSFNPDNWVEGTLGTETSVFYSNHRSGFPLFTVVGGSLPFPDDKFLLAGEYPPRVAALNPDQKTAEVRGMTEALYAAGALS